MPNLVHNSSNGHLVYNTTNGHLVHQGVPGVWVTITGYLVSYDGATEYRISGTYFLTDINGSYYRWLDGTGHMIIALTENIDGWYLYMSTTGTDGETSSAVAEWNNTDPADKFDPSYAYFYDTTSGTGVYAVTAVSVSATEP